MRLETSPVARDTVCFRLDCPRAQILLDAQFVLSAQNNAARVLAPARGWG
jgi:hypothetical protein